MSRARTQLAYQRTGLSLVVAAVGLVRSALEHNVLLGLVGVLAGATCAIGLRQALLGQVRDHELSRIAWQAVTLAVAAAVLAIVPVQLW